MAAKPKTIDEYLTALSDDKRAALENLREPRRRRLKSASATSSRFPARRNARGLGCDGEPLRLLPHELFDGGSPQGRAQGL